MTCFSGLCEELGCKLTNFRNRWSAYNEKKKRGVFTVWADRLDRGSGRYVFIEADADDPRAGARELKHHIDAVIRDGAEAFGILCEAKDPQAMPRVRKRFDGEFLIVLRFTVEDDFYVAYVIGEVLVTDVKRGRSVGNIRRWMDALDDLHSEPTGFAVPRRAAGKMSSVFIRDSKIRAAVLDRANGKCEYCGQDGFLLANGSRYVEAHHIIGLARQGPDTMDNVIALCANHHREAHFGRDASRFEAVLRKTLAVVRKQTGGARRRNGR